MGMEDGTMKNRMAIWFAVQLFVLMLIVQVVWAESTPKEQAAEEVRIETGTGNIPQTPEELLLAIKGLVAHKDEDGEALCEQWLGIPKNSWKINDPSPGTREYKMATGRIDPLPPFHFSSAYIDQEGHLFNIFLAFYYNPAFRMTPVLAQKIFGPPTEIWVGSPKAENSAGIFSLTYLYHDQIKDKRYTMKLTFRNKDEDTPEIETIFRKYPEKHIIEEQTRRKDLIVHRNYISTSMRLSM
jgi:hypothetical protein